MGLKENVIIGKLIPAGTGSHVERESTTRINEMAADMKFDREERLRILEEEQQALPLEMVRDSREDSDF